MSWQRVLTLGGLASLSVTALIAILILLLGDFDDTQARILATTFAISATSLLSLPGAILLERRIARALGALTVAVAIAAFGAALVVIWLAEDADSRGSRSGRRSTTRRTTARWARWPCSTSSA